MEIRAVEELVRVMVSSLVDQPQKVAVSSAHDTAREVLTITVSVAEADQGKVIGKQGRTARSMRTILGAASRTVGICCMLNIVPAGV